MSVQFLVRAIGVTLSTAVGRDHDGSAYTNEAAPFGSILSVDRDGNLYIYNVAGGMDAELGSERSSWPNANGCGTVPLYRDYWSVLLLAKEAKEKDTEHKLSPASRAVLDAKVLAVHHRLLPAQMLTVREFMLRDKAA